MNSIESLAALLVAHESGEQIAKTIAELLLNDEGTFLLAAKLDEINDTLELQKQELSTLEKEVLKVVEASDIPLTADKVAEKATKRSLKYRNHASATLRRLAQKGRIVQVGKDGQTILYSRKESPC